MMTPSPTAAHRVRFLSVKILEGEAAIFPCRLDGEKLGGVHRHDEGMIATRFTARQGGDLRHIKHGVCDFSFNLYDATVEIVVRWPDGYHATS